MSPLQPLELNELPRTPLAPAPAPASVFPFSFPARQARRVLYVLPPLLIGVWAVANWCVLYEGAARLPSASPGWLLTAVVFDSLCWVAASCMRQGCVPERLPPRLLLASQVAAGAANHIVPAGLGGHAITLRLLRGRGIPMARATASLALYSLVKPIGRMVLILALVASFPGTVRMGMPALDERMVVVAVGGAIGGLVLAVLAVTVIPPVRRTVLGFLRVALTDARVLHTRPSRVLALWGGAAAFPLFQASAFACVGASLGLPLAWQHMVLAYLAAGAAVGAIPAPGGIGSVDAALVFTLAAFGAPMALATSAVIGHRVLTAWLPLLPAALVLSALVRSKAL
ncbi:lysylphosphatidylglycerol synthase transmembrane domain-containing protein [Streptomyces sp. 6N223]|uniref:lysylphosphatidylglycerol synthase transmembrane domain-containing protein n=1 Tax=Streptomyces sp. 6N223 TaxID=3457412 RepID=UPI003FD209F2